MQKLLSLGALVALLAFFSACDKEDENSNLSKDQAQAEIAEFNATATQDLQALADAEGLKALADLSQLTQFDDPFGGRQTTDKKKLRNFFRHKGHQFTRIFSKESQEGRTKGSEPFDFDANKGVYEWNALEEVFVKTGTSGIIIVKFPTEGSDSNNAELRLTAYEEVFIYDAEFEEAYYEPEVLEASLLVDNAEVASLDLAIDWDESGIPLTADVTISVVPFTAHIAFDVTASTKNTLAASLKRNNETLFATSVVVLYSDDSKSEESLKTIEGFIQLKNLALKGSIDVEGMDNQQDEVDLNDYVKLHLESDGHKLGDIVFVTEMVDGFEETVAYVKYNDGTQQKLEDVIQPVVDELEQMSEDLNG